MFGLYNCDQKYQTRNLLPHPCAPTAIRSPLASGSAIYLRLKEDITPLRAKGLTLRPARRPVLADRYAFKFPNVVPTHDVSFISTCQSVLCLAQGPRMGVLKMLPPMPKRRALYPIKDSTTCRIRCKTSCRFDSEGAKSTMDLCCENLDRPFHTPLHASTLTMFIVLKPRNHFTSFTRVHPTLTRVRGLTSLLKDVISEKAYWQPLHNRFDLEAALLGFYIAAR